jgi:hypothetical protein
VKDDLIFMVEMKIRLAILRILLLLTITFCITNANAQTVINGFVRDADTQEPLSSVSIYFKGGNGVTSHEDGSYSIETSNSRFTTLIFSYAGYKRVTKKIVPQTSQTLNINLQFADSLKEVIIKAKRGKYRNKNNPAVALIEKVIANKDKNKITEYDFVQYEEYEKLELSVVNKPKKFANTKLFKNYHFILDNMDTTSISGRALVPIYLEEKLSQNYYRKKPAKKQTYTIAEKKVNYGDFVDDKGVTFYLKRLYADINIYDNNIIVLTTQFLSPIADLSPTFYRFFITDTVENDGIKLVKLNFMPRNTSDLLFSGVMYVTLDGNYGVQKINMSVGKRANLNWAKEIKIAQDFEKSAVDGRYHVIKSSMRAEFSLRQTSAGGVLGQRTVSYKDFVINVPAADSIYRGKSNITQLAPGTDNDSFWVSKRHQQLSPVEAKVYANIDSLRNMKSFNNTVKIATLLFSGYIKFGGFELGNTNTFYSFNNLEGFRLKLGGRTTPQFNKHIYLEGYTAYGFKDEKFKYRIAGAYSFNGKSIYAYPLNYIKFIREYDVNLPGQELIFESENNFFLSFKRGVNDQFLYNDVYKLLYLKEFAKDFAYRMSYTHLKQTPADSLVYEKNFPVAGKVNIPYIINSEIMAELRWAPHQEFYQGLNYRTPIKNRYPIYLLRLQQGIKGLFNGQFNYTQATLGIAKRVYLSQLGYADVTVEGSHIFGQVPFPLLNILRGNQSYAFQLNAYNLMNYLEFVTDNYFAVTSDFFFNGFILNKIPLLKKLKLREVADFKFVAGSLRNENNPAYNPNTLLFPTRYVNGVDAPSTFALTTPYFEASVGIANIFKVVRLDIVKRFTYLNHPNISTLGLRVRIRGDF